MLVSKKEPKLPTGLSPSSIDLYEQCPRRFEEEKIKGMFSHPGVEAMLGTFVHRILELLMQKPPEERTLDVAKECARLAWPETESHGSFKNLRLDENAKLRFRWDAWKSIENYFEMEPPAGVEVVATERNVKATLNGVPIRGIIDRLDREDGRLVVSDYKNGKLPNAKYDKGAKANQLNYYAGLVQELEGELPAKGRLIFTAHSTVIPVEFTEESVQIVLNKAKEIWDEVHANFAATDYSAPGQSAFPPKPSMLCAWCPVMMQCPEGKANVTMMKRMGRLKDTAPGYAAVGGSARAGRFPSKKKKR